MPASCFVSHWERAYKLQLLEASSSEINSQLFGLVDCTSLGKLQVCSSFNLPLILLNGLYLFCVIFVLRLIKSLLVHIKFQVCYLTRNNYIFYLSTKPFWNALGLNFEYVILLGKRVWKCQSSNCYSKE